MTEGHTKALASLRWALLPHRPNTWAPLETPLAQHAGHSSAFIPVTTAPSSRLNNHAGPVPGPGTRWWTKQIPCSQRASTPHKSSYLVFIIAFGGDTVIVSEQSLDVRGFGARPAHIPSSHAGCWPCKAWLGPRGTVWNSSELGLEPDSGACLPTMRQKNSLTLKGCLLM